MNKYKIGTFVIIILTLLLTGMVYRLGYSVRADESSLQHDVEARLAEDREFAALSKEVAVLRWEVLKGRLVVFFTLRHHPDYQGVAIFQKGFNQAYRPEKIVLQNRDEIAHEFLYTGGLDHLLLYSNHLPAAVHSLVILEEGRWELLVDKFQAKSFLYTLSETKANKLMKQVRETGRLPQILGYSSKGELLFDSRARTLLSAPKAQQRYFVQEVSIPVNGWVLAILLVGISLAIYLWQEGLRFEEEKKQTRESIILSALLQKAQATAPEGVKIY